MKTTDPLSPAAREIERAWTQRSILRDRLDERRERVADLWVRALVSETPQADQAYRLAEEECRRVEAEIARIEERLGAFGTPSVGPLGSGGSP
ncbi:MAG TPA: hypothetical protein VF058_06785 [Actinomycetota bacterium]